MLGNPSRNFHLLAWLTLVMTISAHSQSFQADAERFVTTFAEQKSFQGVILVARSGEVLILELVVWQAGRMVDQFLDGNCSHDSGACGCTESREHRGRVVPPGRAENRCSRKLFDKRCQLKFPVQSIWNGPFSHGVATAV